MRRGAGGEAVGAPLDFARDERVSGDSLVTGLGTDERVCARTPTSFVPSVVEGRVTGANAGAALRKGGGGEAVGAPLDFARDERICVRVASSGSGALVPHGAPPPDATAAAWRAPMGVGAPAAAAGPARARGRGAEGVRFAPPPGAARKARPARAQAQPAQRPARKRKGGGRRFTGGGRRRAGSGAGSCPSGRGRCGADRGRGEARAAPPASPRRCRPPRAERRAAPRASRRARR